MWKEDSSSATERTNTDSKDATRTQRKNKSIKTRTRAGETAARASGLHYFLKNSLKKIPTIKKKVAANFSNFCKEKLILN